MDPCSVFISPSFILGLQKKLSPFCNPLASKYKCNKQTNLFKSTLWNLVNINRFWVSLWHWNLVPDPLGAMCNVGCLLCPPKSGTLKSWCVMPFLFHIRLGLCDLELNFFSVFIQKYHTHFLREREGYYAYS